MAFSITPPSIDSQAKVSAMDTVKNTVSSMAGKLRDIFNTMIPGRTGSWTPSKPVSPRSSFALSMSGSFSTRSSIVSNEPEERIRQHSIARSIGQNSPSLSSSESTSWLYGEGLRHIAEPASMEAALVSIKDISSPWEMSNEEIMQSDAPHVLEHLPSHGNRSPSDFSMPRGRLIPRISQDSQSRSSISSSASSLSEFDFLDSMSGSSKA